MFARAPDVAGFKGVMDRLFNVDRIGLFASMQSFVIPVISCFVQLRLIAFIQFVEHPGTDHGRYPKDRFLSYDLLLFKERQVHALV